MQPQPLHAHNLNDKINLINFTELNGVIFELNVSYNFSRRQLDAFNNKQFLVKYTKFPVSYFEDPTELNETENSYSRTLAFYRRISLPIEVLLSTPLMYDKFPVDTIKNFEIFDELFERYYDEFDKSSKSSTLKSSFYTRCKTLILKLWMAGYGIYPGYTNNHLTDEFIEYLSKIYGPKKGGTLKKFCRFISFALSQDPLSPVTQLCSLLKNTSLKDREIGKWDKVLKEHSTEVGLEFKRFTFDNIFPRTLAPTIHEFYTPQGTLSRITYEKIVPGTFVNYSGELRTLFSLLDAKGYTSIESVINEGLFNILSEDVLTYNDTKSSTIRIVARLWITWYKHEHGLDFNINRIIPVTVSNRITTFGQVLNYGATNTLIDALLDDNCPFYETSSITDYRCRYICLLMLSSGQRVSEICNLAYDCLKTNKENMTSLIIHKTKTGNGNIIKATPDIIEYVDKLRLVAPTLPILFPSNKYKTGDDLKVRRLTSNKFEDGPILEFTVNNFLLRLQQYLWGDLSQKDRRFTCHSFRRMRAVYMKLTNHSKEDIQEQLGQMNINSQLPYLQTKPLHHQKHFEEIYNEGIYTASEDTLLEQISTKTTSLRYTEEDNHQALISSLLESIQSVEDFHVPQVDTSSLSPTGFPIGLHNCNASIMVNCSASPIHCFSCDFYTPEKNTLLDHKVEIFRYMILNLLHRKTVKNSKDILLKNILLDKINSIDTSINDALEHLSFKFGMSNTDTKSLKEFLEKKSKKYFKLYANTNPSPSFKDAKNFLEEN